MPQATWTTEDTLESISATGRMSVLVAQRGLVAEMRPLNSCAGGQCDGIWGPETKRVMTEWMRDNFPNFPRTAVPTQNNRYVEIHPTIAAVGLFLAAQSEYSPRRMPAVVATQTARALPDQTLPATNVSRSGPLGGIPWWVWAGGATVLVGGGAYLYASR